MYNLKDMCSVSTGYENDNFVGIEIANGIPKVKFPLGYFLGETDKEIRNDILLLIRILKRFTSDMADNWKTIKNDFVSNNVFPIFSYQRMINYYITNGNYNEIEPICVTANKGKINWSKTIKQIKPQLQNNNAFYLDFIVKSKSEQENLITEIYKYCVYISFNNIGWLYTEHKYEKPKMKFNKKLFISVINQKLTETYNDRKKELFYDMLKIISNYNDEKDNNLTRAYGTYNFEYIWEKLIDSAFGVKNKSDFFPRTTWHLKTKSGNKINHCLEPDTIMINDDFIYLIDAKYYRYGSTGFPNHLPETSSIHKQITYGEFVDKKYVTSFKGIFNAFLMPANLKNGLFASDDVSSYIGTAKSDWKTNDLPYEKIMGILIDTKILMQQYLYSVELKNSIVNNISQNI